MIKNGASKFCHKPHLGGWSNTKEAKAPVEAEKRNKCEQLGSYQQIKEQKNDNNEIVAPVWTVTMSGVN